MSSRRTAEAAAAAPTPCPRRGQRRRCRHGWVSRVGIPNGRRIDKDDDEEDDDDLDDDRDEGSGDRVEYAYAWRRPDDTIDPVPKRVLHPTEFAFRLSLRGTVPDATRLLEATGNEGSTQERRYHRAALVFWRPDAEAALLARSPVEEVRAYLAAELAAESTRGRARERIAGIVAAWADPASVGTARPSAAMCLPFLRLLVQAGLPDSVRIYVEWLSTTRRLKVGDDSALSTWMKELPAEHHGWLFAAAILDTPVADELGLLRRASQGLGALSASGRRTVVDAMYTRLLGPVEYTGYRRGSARWGRSAITFSVVLEIVGRFGTRVQKEVLVSNIREKLEEWPVETLLVPTLARLVAGRAPLDPAWEPLREVCLGLLYARTAFPPEAPEDHRRSVDGLKCSCSHCVEVRAFLQSPTQTSWRLQAPIATRRHVEEELLRARAEVDCTTRKERTPHTLVLVKNKARFQQARLRYVEDQALIRALGGEV